MQDLNELCSMPCEKILKRQESLTFSEFLELMGYSKEYQNGNNNLSEEQLWEHDVLPRV